MAQQANLQRFGKIKVADLNSLLTCVLCNGYFIDATTISECLHSFCKTCIVKYLQTNKFCPICEVQVHKTRPLLSIRADQTLQDIVYKVVPGLFKNEMKRRRDFYAKENGRGNIAMIPVSGEKRGDVLNCERLIFTHEDVISISLEYCPPSLTFPLKIPGESDDASMTPSSDSPLLKYKAHRRYLQCPGGLTVFHLKKFLRAKYGLPSFQDIDIMYMHDQLLDEYTLVDLAYSYSWRRNGPMRLFYKIHEISPHLKESGEEAASLVNVPLILVPSCPDLPVSSSPSVAAAPTSQLHYQCHPSPPPSPQTAVEPGDIRVGNPNCASMSNQPSAFHENCCRQSDVDPGGKLPKHCKLLSLSKDCYLVADSRSVTRSPSVSKTKSQYIQVEVGSKRSAESVRANKSWRMSCRIDDTLNCYGSIKKSTCKTSRNFSDSKDISCEIYHECKFNSKHSSVYQKSELSRNLLASTPVNKPKPATLQISNSSL